MQKLTYVSPILLLDDGGDQTITYEGSQTNAGGEDPWIVDDGDEIIEG